jgi:hypothetical protein
MSSDSFKISIDGSNQIVLLFVTFRVARSSGSSLLPAAKKLELDFSTKLLDFGLETIGGCSVLHFLNVT